MLKLKQYFCKHDFYLIAKHRIVSENLYKCSRCNVYMARHMGIGVSFKTKELPSKSKWGYLE